MNTSTGHLVRDIKLEDVLSKEYTPIPDELKLAAKKKLGKSQETYVSLTSGGKLSKWAAKERKKKKIKRKMQKQSRRINRNM